MIRQQSAKKNLTIGVKSFHHFINRTKNNNYELKGSFLNADPIITSLLESKDDQQLNIFKENIKISLNVSDVYFDNNYVIKNLKGKLQIIDNKVDQADIFALFDDNKI